MRVFKVAIFLILPLFLQAQGHKFGVRAGTDFSKFIGPTEEGESFSFSNGFHFGINYSFFFTDYFGLGAELLYQQKGTQRNFNGDSFYPIHKPGETSWHFEDGQRDMALNISNAYISIPMTVHLKPFKKLEWIGGLNANFLILPVGSGSLTFTSDINPTGLFFDQTLVHQYYEDDNGDEFSSTAPFNPAVFCGDDVVRIPGSVGAYYHIPTADDKERLFNWFDLTAVTGFNVYYNKSLYFGGRVEYGLLDLTNEKVDYSLAEHNGNNFVFRDDRDVHFGFQVSLGFRF